MPATISRRDLRDHRSTNMLVTRATHGAPASRTMSEQAAERLWAAQVATETAHILPRR